MSLRLNLASCDFYQTTSASLVYVDCSMKFDQMTPYIKHRSKPAGGLNINSRSGSVLLLTLLVVSLLMMLVLGFVVLIRMELREMTHHQQRVLARANARLGMELALSRLQMEAGPDRRVTGTASLLDDDTETLSIENVLHPNWSGVWRKQDPNTRTHNPEFLGWMVSLNADRADFESTSRTALDPTRRIQLVGEGTVLHTDQEVWAETLDLTGGSGDVEGRYAYLVLDEGVKASLSLEDPYEGGSSTEQRFSQSLAQRQSAELIPGFSASESGVPVLEQSTDLVNRALNRSSLALVHPEFQEGARVEFHDTTLRTYGVLSDTAQGGLKRDLSTAFEATDTEFEAMTAFHDSGERNTGNGGFDQGFDLGYVYALDGGSANMDDPAEADWSSSSLKIRGPTWDRLRNFYRLYRERDALGGLNGLTARASGPHRFEGLSREESPVLSYASTKQADVLNRDTFDSLYVFGNLNQSGNVIRKTESALAPVVTRVMYVFSLARESGNLVLVMNNLIVIHNPYDVPLEFRGFKFSPAGLPIERLRIRRRFDPAGDLDKDITGVNNWLRFLNGASNPWTYVNYIFTSDGTDSPSNRMVMQPGEVIAFSNTDDPLAYGSTTVGKVGLASGPEYEVDSGLYFSRFGEGTTNPDHSSNYVQAIEVADDSRIWVEIELKGGWGNYLFFTPDTLDATSDSWERSHSSDALLGRLDIPIGTLTGGGRTIGSLSGDYVTGAELGNGLDERIPLFVMDARLKPLNDDAAVLTSYNPRAMLTQGRFLNGGVDHWEARLYEINSFNEIDLDLDISSGRNNAYWGPSISAGSGETHVPLFEVPRGPMLSPAGFMHAEMGNFAHDPALSVGNSYAHPLIDRDAVYNFLGNDDSAYSVVDQSFLMNEGLWDSVFFSTLIPRPDRGWSLADTAEAFQEDGEPLPNHTVRFDPAPGVSSAQVADDLLNPERAAAHLMVEGVFNVNSTSVEAWTAVLSGIRDQSIERAGGAIDPVSGTFFSRFERPEGGSGDLYKGYLDLTDAEIVELAEAVVREVKVRGPFLSVADFVNRRLATDDTGLMGPLQAAIERAGLNDRFPSASPGSDNWIYPDHQAERTAAGAPGYLLQSDLLRLIGPRLTVRSDTFRIRAYGEVPGSTPATPGSRVWCEALVQRTSMPVESLNPISAGVSAGNYEPADLEWLGRRFKILSFRYLNPDEM